MPFKKYALAFSFTISAFFIACGSDSESNPAEVNDEHACDATTEATTYMDELESIVYTCHNSQWLNPQELKAALDAEFGTQDTTSKDTIPQDTVTKTEPTEPTEPEKNNCNFAIEDPVWTFDYTKYGNPFSSLYEIFDGYVLVTETSISAMDASDCSTMIENMGGADEWHYCKEEGLYQVETKRIETTESSRTSKEDLFKEAMEKCNTK